tara:strand:- start:862 stop:1002 length:141 start_codon:yes stop_codon:yes gene_type:complete
LQSQQRINSIQNIFDVFAEELISAYYKKPIRNLPDSQLEVIVFVVS